MWIATASAHHHHNNSYTCTGTSLYNKPPDRTLVERNEQLLLLSELPPFHVQTRLGRRNGSSDPVMPYRDTRTPHALLSKFNRSYLIIFRSADANASTLSETVHKSREFKGMHCIQDIQQTRVNITAGQTIRTPALEKTKAIIQYTNKPDSAHRKKCNTAQQNKKNINTPTQKIHLSCLARRSTIRIVSPLTPSVLATLYSRRCVPLRISRCSPRSASTARPRSRNSSSWLLVLPRNDCSRSACVSRL